MKASGQSVEEKHPRFCDVVMKGGITSGVVYPRAVVTLAQQFRPKNIGGTSAGAIAAAAAAAAEFGKRTGSKTGDRDLLAGLPGLLSQSNPSGNTNLFTFFQPQAKTAALFNTLTGALEANSGAAAFIKVLGRATMYFWPWTLIGLVPGMALGALELFCGCGFLALLWIGLGIFVGLEKEAMTLEGSGTEAPPVAIANVNDNDGAEGGNFVLIDFAEMGSDNVNETLVPPYIRRRAIEL